MKPRNEKYQCASEYLKPDHINVDGVKIPKAILIGETLSNDWDEMSGDTISVKDWKKYWVKESQME